MFNVSPFLCMNQGFLTTFWFNDCLSLSRLLLKLDVHHILMLIHDLDWDTGRPIRCLLVKPWPCRWHKMRPGSGPRWFAVIPCYTPEFMWIHRIPFQGFIQQNKDMDRFTTCRERNIFICIWEFVIQKFILHIYLTFILGILTYPLTSLRVNLLR